MATIATLFSGGEGVGVGARTAGLTHLWGIEYDDAIANVARANGFYVITADVMTVDPYTLEVPDVLHVSTVCKRASLVNNNKTSPGETREDIAMGEKVSHFIDVMTPKVFTLENVFAYRRFEAFKIICQALNHNGYMWDFDNLNSANYGVPQTRERLILRAVKGALIPNLPLPERWVGWMEALEDLLPTFLPWQLANWQKKILPLSKPILLIGNNQGGDTRDRLSCVTPDKPSFTITVSNSAKNRILINDKVLRPTLRAQARLQSIPDDYNLFGKGEAVRQVIGNAVPPLLYQKIIRQLI